MNEELLLATFIIVTTLLVCWRIIEGIRWRLVVRRVRLLHIAAELYHKTGNSIAAKDCLEQATKLLKEVA